MFSVKHASVLCILVLVSISTAQTTVIDVSVNPVPNVIADAMDKDIQVFSGGIEIGEPYLAGTGAKYAPAVCLLLDQAKYGRAEGWVFRLGYKRYLGTRALFHLRGNSFMWSVGPTYFKRAGEKHWGAVLSLRGAYKFLLFRRLIAEPFGEYSYMLSKAIETTLASQVTLGVNVGLRVISPNY